MCGHRDIQPALAEDMHQVMLSVMLLDYTKQLTIINCLSMTCRKCHLQVKTSW